MNVGLVGIAKNEERSLLEWITYHAAVGFTSFIIYDNNSTDKTVEVAKRAAEIYDVRLVPWPTVGAAYQLTAYDDSVARYGGEFEWLAFLDIDEFFVAARDGSVPKFLEKMDDHSAIALNWAMFGSSGHEEPPEGLITQSYTKRAPAAFPPNCHVKTLLRPEVFIRFQNAHVAEVRSSIVGPGGAPVSWLQDGITETVEGFEIARINHYFIKSRRDWINKVGRGYSDNLQRSVSDFEEYDHNDVEDSFAARVLANVALP